MSLNDISLFLLFEPCFPIDHFLLRKIECKHHACRWCHCYLHQMHRPYLTIALPNVKEKKIKISSSRRTARLPPHASTTEWGKETFSPWFSKRRQIGATPSVLSPGCHHVQRRHCLYRVYVCSKFLLKNDLFTFQGVNEVPLDPTTKGKIHRFYMNSNNSNLSLVYFYFQIKI